MNWMWEKKKIMEDGVKSDKDDDGEDNNNDDSGAIVVIWIMIAIWWYKMMIEMINFAIVEIVMMVDWNVVDYGDNEREDEKHDDNVEDDKAVNIGIMMNILILMIDRRP